MEGNEAARAAAVLKALAAMAPAAQPRSPSLVIPQRWFRWIPARAVVLLQADAMAPDSSSRPGVAIDAGYGERLAAVDQVRTDQHPLRVGWLFVAGRVPDADGKARRVFHPLVTVPVHVEREGWLRGTRLVPAGDAELTDLIPPGDVREALEQRIEVGGGSLDWHNDAEVQAALLERLPKLQRFAIDAAEAAGFPASRLVPGGAKPDALIRDDELVVAAGCGAYAVDDIPATSRAATLSTWASQPLATPTALHAVYLGYEPAGTAPNVEPVESPFLLTPAQRAAVVRSRHAPVTVIAGAPGTGKSHTIAAIACDALARNETVLIAAKADATVDALVDLMQRAPGPDPVVFGSNERRRQLAATLADGVMAAVGDDDVRDARRRFDEALQHRNAVYEWFFRQLHAEALSSAGAHARTDAWAAAPRLFDAALDLAEVARMLALVRATGGGWWARRKRRKLARQLGNLTDTPPTADGLSTLEHTLPVAEAARLAATLASRGGIALAPHWQTMRDGDDRARDLGARWLAVEGRSARRFTPANLATVAALGTSLRAGRAARRQHLRRLNRTLTSALPLWAGTLADVDDLLPPLAALFDVVILDEASSIDQLLAAPALLRGRRAVVVGDPRQLRHVSFIADDQIATALASSSLDADPVLAARLDVRRNSAFDVAAGSAPVGLLDEHFRSAPHLVEFVARRLYEGSVKVATRSPITESTDCVELRPIDGQRDDSGVVKAEVEAIVDELARLAADGARSVGVVTPFRAQADALEQAVLARFSADELEALDLRVGTVHQFQGNERDLVLASLAIGPDDSGAPWTFVGDPHLLAVFLTRARRRFVLFHSASPPPGSILADYLAQADRPPGTPPSAGAPAAWTGTIAHDLAAAGVPVAVSYPVGRHVVDLAVGDGERAVAIDCSVHPDGPAAHIDRNLALLRSGWHLLDAFESRWAERRGELVVELAHALRAQR